MPEHNTRAERWLDAALRERVTRLRLTALWQFLIGLGACCAWWIGGVGLLFSFWFIFAFVGIRLPFPPFVGLLVFAVQFGLFLVVRRKTPAKWEVSRDVDGDLVVVPPNHRNTPDHIYNQDHDFSFRRAYIGVFLAGPIAFDEAWRAWREASRLKRLDRAPLAQLAAMLFDEQRKLTFAELRNGWLEGDLTYAVQHAAELPGFQLFSHDPQGVALTDDAIHGLLAE